MKGGEGRGEGSDGGRERETELMSLMRAYV